MANETQAENSFMFMLKTSVALAIIRSKPDGVTGAQHAQNLYQKMLSQNLQRKRKCIAMQTEITSLKSKLFKMECQSISGEEAVTSVTLTPPSSSETISNQDYSFMRIKTLKLLTKTLQNYVNLQKDGVADEDIHTKFDQAVVMKSIEDVYQNTKDMITEIPKNDIDLICLSIHTFTDLSNVIHNATTFVTSDRLSTIHDATCDKCMAIASQLHNDVMMEEMLASHNIQETRISLILQISNATSLRCSILLELSKAICNFGVCLCNEDQHISVSCQHDNICYLLQTAEQIVMKMYTDEVNTQNEPPETETDETQNTKVTVKKKNIDQCLLQALNRAASNFKEILFNLNESEVLFAMYLWNLISLINKFIKFLTQEQ